VIAIDASLRLLLTRTKAKPGLRVAAKAKLWMTMGIPLPRTKFMIFSRWRILSRMV